MKKSTKFSDVLHVLMHMAGHSGPATSESLAKAMRSNPVVVRRTMAGLRECGFVQSEKGHGGGWQLTCDLKYVTLLDVYRAIGAPTIFAIGNRGNSKGCLVEKAVNAAMNGSFQDAENMLIAKFKSTTLTDLHDIIKKHSHT